MQAICVPVPISSCSSSPSRAGPIPSSTAAGGEIRANRMFVFGLGFTGRCVSHQMKKEGWEVAGTCTSAIRKRELEEMDLDAFIFYVHKNREIYNDVDDDPSPQAEVFAYAQALIKSRWPYAISDAVELESQILKVKIESGEKCVSNDRLKEKLGLELLYPSYKPGLQNILNYYSEDYYL